MAGGCEEQHGAACVQDIPCGKATARCAIDPGCSICLHERVGVKRVRVVQGRTGVARYLAASAVPVVDTTVLTAASANRKQRLQQLPSQCTRNSANPSYGSGYPLVRTNCPSVPPRAHIDPGSSLWKPDHTSPCHGKQRRKPKAAHQGISEHRSRWPRTKLNHLFARM